MARLLTFFGVPWRTLIKEGFVIQNACDEVSSKIQIGLLVSFRRGQPWIWQIAWSATRICGKGLSS